MKAISLISLSLLWITLLIIFPILAVRPGKEPDFGSDSPASKAVRPLSRTACIQDEADTTEAAPLQCAHLIFNMIRPVHLLRSDVSSSDEVDCLQICDKRFREESKLGFGGLSTIAHKNKWTSNGVIKCSTGKSTRFSDTCQASGAICVDVLEASNIVADHDASTHRKRKANFAQGTCMSTEQVNSACASETTLNPSAVGCLCKVRFQLYNSYVGYGTVLPADPYHGRRYDCRPSSICRRLQDDRYPGWFCKVDDEIPVICPQLKHTKGTRFSMHDDDHKVCKCNKYGSGSCEEVYSKVIELRPRALMPSPDHSQPPRLWTDLMQTHSQMVDALNKVEQIHDGLKLKMKSIEAQIAQYKSSSQFMGAPPMLHELASAQNLEVSPDAQFQLNGPESVPGEEVLPIASPAAGTCGTDFPAGVTEQEQDATITALDDTTYWGDFCYEDETQRFMSEYREYFGLPLL